MAAPRHRNASELSRVIAHGAYLYAVRQDAKIGSPAYVEADRKWDAWVEIEGETLADHARSLQTRAFDIALNL